MSGGDSDGAHGLQAIKDAGGITFSQTPQSAKFSGMPQSAIDTGCVDFVLRPADIGREIIRLNDHPYLHSATNDQQAEEPVDHEEALKQIFRRLRLIHGVDFRCYKRSTLNRRLRRRMALRRINSLEAYAELLEDDPVETVALYQDFLIRVTHFFRDPESFDELITRVFPNVCEARSPKEPIRIWVPGCATGEEVYSIAIVLLEYLGEGALPRIQLFGTDVNEPSLEKARAGVYPDSIVEDISAQRLEKFFTKNDGRYQISKRIRELCIFARHDVTRDPPFSKLDLISCRNLLIYLDNTAQRRVMQLFHYALRPKAFLILGPSESIGTATAQFELVDKPHRIYTRKATAPIRLDLDPVEQVIRTPMGKHDSENQMNEFESLHQEADRYLLSRYAPASLLVDESLNILQFRGETSRYLEHASGAASLNLHRVVRASLLVEISPAIQECRKTGGPIRREGLRVDELMDVTFEVVPFQTPENERCYLIVFEDTARIPGGRREQARPLSTLPESEKDRRLAQLEREIISTREYMQAALEKHEAVKEELKSAHEEVLSANEEFQSSNEELETAKEELQSSNEELTTTNEELRGRNAELSISNAELTRTREVAVRAQNYADAIVDSVREPLAILDSTLTVIRANKSFYRDFDLRRAEIEGCLLSKLGTGQWNEEPLLEQLNAVLSDNVSLDEFQLEYSRAPGAAVRKLLVNARKIPGDMERKQLILLAIEDVTERDADAEQLRNVDRRKDEFLAMLAHELRNPLAPIMHSVKLLKNGKDNVPTAKLHEVIERQTKRLVRLVDELLDVARINRGQIDLKLQPVNLAMMVQQAADAARTRFDERQQELIVVLPKMTVPVSGDPVRLEQVVANLLDNASKYTDAGGRIEVNLTQTGSEAILSVRDNGIGLAHEHLLMIFDLFTQVDSSLARSSGGLGIGLRLASRLLELHGGWIEARSAGLGHGTEFIVRLPLDLSIQKSGPLRTEAIPEILDRESRRLLIVDDNADAADMIALLARHWGHEVALAHDGLTALTIAKEFQPEVALVDIGLPGMDGYELAHLLREYYQDIYLVAMTGYGRDEDRKSAMVAGFNAHVVKPADVEELHRILTSRSHHSNNA